MSHTTIAALLDEIARMDDPAARNLEITRCYRDLALALSQHLGQRDLNWFGFDAWASGTAGQAIRGEGVPIDFGTARNVAAGNLAIIADVAPPFLAWLAEIERAGGPTRDACNRALADPLLLAAPKLAASILAYQAAIELAAARGNNQPDSDASDKAIAELVLLGNVLTGAHEQSLVDRFIDGAMPLGGIFGLVTTRFIHIVTPDGPLDVSRDVPIPGYLSGEQFPAVLADLSNPALVALAAQFGQSPATDVTHSDAWTWESYDERMGFILTFFRAYQCDQRYYDVPARFLPAAQ